MWKKQNFVFTHRDYMEIFDWIGHFVFDSIEQYELESNNFYKQIH